MAATGDVAQYLPIQNFDCTDSSVYKPAVVDKAGFMGRPLKVNGAVMSYKVQSIINLDASNFTLDSDAGARQLFGGLVACQGAYGANRTLTLPRLDYLQPYINQWGGCMSGVKNGVGSGTVSGTTLTRYTNIITFNISNYTTAGAWTLTIVAGAGTVLNAVADRVIAAGETVPINLFITRAANGTLSYAWNVGLSI